MTMLAVVVAALIASIVSATTGVAGGVMLLAVLVFVVPAAAVVPIHAAVQLVAGTSRAIAYRRFVHWGIVGRFTAALLPGSLLGMVVVRKLASWDPALLEVAMALLILLSVLRLRLPGPDQAERRSAGMWQWGLACGFLGVIVGSTGPLVSRALLARGVTKEEHVATKAWAQIVAHAIKIPLFGLALDFRFGEHATLVLWLCLAAVAGTLVGRRLLGRIEVERSVLLTRILLGGVAVTILVRHAAAIRHFW